MPHHAHIKFNFILIIMTSRALIFPRRLIRDGYFASIRDRDGAATGIAFMTNGFYFGMTGVIEF